MAGCPRCVPALGDGEGAVAGFELHGSGGPGGRSFEEQEALEERFGRYCEAFDSSMIRLLAVPAPDLGALVVKIALISDHLVWEMEGGEECLVWLEADARRLAAARG